VIAFDVTDAVKHDLFDAGQSQYTGFVLYSSYNLEGNFYDNTSPDHAPRLIITCLECDCDQDSDCDDGLYCNGAETCVDSLCVAGAAPCSDGLLCDELGGTCYECLADADCDDGIFCNGPETCVDGLCTAAAEPCQTDEICDEDLDLCVECLNDSDCTAGYSCINSQCVDTPPAIGDGPFLAAGTWPILPTDPESPIYLGQNYDVLWTFSDDYASCPELCTHSAAVYSIADGTTAAELSVETDPTGEWYASAELPVAEELENATTYALRFSVTDCAGQSTTSEEYYFRVAPYDDPPVIESGPFLAAGAWPLLPSKASNALILTQNYDVLWTFSDDYATCSGDCTHRARYRKYGTSDWTWLPVETDPTGQWYAYTTLPVASLAPGTYQFQFDVRDCAGQYTFPPHFYYITVE
jgi:hypothetical protein